MCDRKKSCSTARYFYMSLEDSKEASYGAAVALSQIRHDDKRRASTDQKPGGWKRNKNQRSARWVEPFVSDFIETVMSMVSATKGFPVDQWLADWKKSSSRGVNAGSLLTRVCTGERHSTPGSLVRMLHSQKAIDEFEFCNSRPQPVVHNGTEGILEKMTTCGSTYYFFRVLLGGDTYESKQKYGLGVASFESFVCSVYCLKQRNYSLQRIVERLRNVWIQTSRRRVLAAVEFLDFVREKR